jgi:hypothetical protein
MFQELLITDNGLTFTIQGPAPPQVLLSFIGHGSSFCILALPLRRAVCNPSPTMVVSQTYDQCSEVSHWRVFFCSPWLYRGHGACASRLSPRLRCPDAMDVMFGRQGKPAALSHSQLSPLTPVSGRSPFVHLGRWLNF